MKKILIGVLIVLALFIPTYIALGSYIIAQNSPVDKDSVTKMVINSPDGREFSFNKATDSESEKKNASEVIGKFIDMNSEATKVASLPSDVNTSDKFKVVYYSYDFETEYDYYFTNDPSVAYYTDNNGASYRISEDAASEFVYSQYATALYPASATPNMTVVGNDVLPQNILWKYLLANNDYAQSIANTTTDPQTVTISGNLGLAFDIQPDYLLVQIYDGSTELYNDIYENISKITFTENATYSVIVTAKWYESAARQSYGEAQYNFSVNIVAPPVFLLGAQSIEHGEFVVITGKNIMDASNITFTSSPDINFTPTFFAEGTTVHAIVPISYALEYSPNYTFTISCEGTENVLNLAVESKTFRTQNYDVSVDIISQYHDGNATAAFADAMAPYFANKEAGAYFGGKLGYPSASIESLTGTVKTGFGTYRTLTVIGTTYRHEGVDFMVASEDPVNAAYGGKVIFAGQTVMSGRTVIIEHGWGLKTLYAHLSSISVEEGAMVNQGDQIGIVGSTGFTADIRLHFGMYIYDVPVSPYNYFDYGIPIA